MTTQAVVKRENRKIEIRLRELEFMCACLPVGNYPVEALTRVWKRLLINQFHDIIPGSSITSVYEDTLKDYNEAQAECDKLEEDTAGIAV